MTLRPTRSTLFPYTTLFRSHKWRGWKRWLKGEYDAHKARTHFLVTGSARLDVYRKGGDSLRSEEHTSELQSQSNIVCRLLLEKKKHCFPERRPGGQLIPINH